MKLMPQGLFSVLRGKHVESRILTMFSLKSQFAISCPVYSKEEKKLLWSRFQPLQNITVEECVTEHDIT